jgi:DNA repair exonuclease SbcCD nuclease subunit
MASNYELALAVQITRDELGGTVGASSGKVKLEGEPEEVNLGEKFVGGLVRVRLAEGYKVGAVVGCSIDAAPSTAGQSNPLENVLLMVEYGDASDAVTGVWVSNEPFSMEEHQFFVGKCMRARLLQSDNTITAGGSIVNLSTSELLRVRRRLGRPDHYRSTVHTTGDSVIPTATGPSKKPISSQNSALLAKMAEENTLLLNEVKKRDAEIAKLLLQARDTTSNQIVRQTEKEQLLSKKLETQGVEMKELRKKNEELSEKMKALERGLRALQEEKKQLKEAAIGCVGARTDCSTKELIDRLRRSTNS